MPTRPRHATCAAHGRARAARASSCGRVLIESGQVVRCPGAPDAAPLATRRRCRCHWGRKNLACGRASKDAYPCKGLARSRFRRSGPTSRSERNRRGLASRPMRKLLAHFEVDVALRRGPRVRAAAVDRGRPVALGVGRRGTSACSPVDFTEPRLDEGPESLGIWSSPASPPKRGKLHHYRQPRLALAR